MLQRLKDKFALAAICMSILLGGVAFAGVAYASTPNLSAYATGSGDDVQINVTGGDANSSVILFYDNNVSGAPSENILGDSDDNGNFSDVLSTSAAGIEPGSNFYVEVGGVESASMAWPYGSSSNSSGSISLSQTSVTLGIGQSTTITVNNANGSSLYLNSNSDPSVANVSFNGSEFTITSNTYGSTDLDVCLTSNNSDCATVSVDVPSATSISFSQNNVTVTPGESLPITISGGDTGAYTVTANSNSGVIQTSISSSTIYLYTSQTSGSATITVCASDMSSCGVITANAGSSSSSSITFSPNNPSMSVGQDTSVVVEGGSGVYYVQSNSDPAIVQDSLSGGNGDTLTLYAESAGTALLDVCASTGGCADLTVTVGGSSSSVTLNESTITVSPGQTVSVLASGGNGSGYYVNNDSNESVAYGAIVDNDIVNITGVNAGTSDITVCQTSSECATVDVTVSGTVSNTSSAPQVSLVVGVGQSVYITLSGGSTPYSLSDVPTSIFEATLNSSSVAITGVSVGNSSMDVCSSNGACAQVYVYVIQSSSAPTATVTNNSGSSNVSSNYEFTEYLYPGLSDEAVTMLQQRLTALGIYSGPITGYYGSLTESAVKKYQNENGIDPLGVVGPETRALLNKY